MPVTNDNYDQLKIDRLRHYLEAQAEKGLPRPFEIFVDSLKVVPKTDDPKEFDSYEFYMNEDTEKVRILIYNSHLSPRNDQYCFLVQKTIGGKSLNGLGEVESIIQEKLAARDREYEMNRLKEELESTREDLAETEQECDRLNKEIEELKANKFKLGSINMPEFAAAMLESVARRNPQALSRLPFGDALAGVLAGDGSPQALQPPDMVAQASFQKDEEPSITEEERRSLAYLRALEGQLSEDHRQAFYQVLHAMVERPELIPIIFELITQNK